MGRIFFGLHRGSLQPWCRECSGTLREETWKPCLAPFLTSPDKQAGPSDSFSDKRSWSAYAPAAPGNLRQDASTDTTNLISICNG